MQTRRRVYARVVTFNRTIVELKFDRSVQFHITVLTFNRTIVELKLDSLFIYKLRQVCF